MRSPVVEKFNRSWLSTTVWAVWCGKSVVQFLYLCLLGDGVHRNSYELLRVLLPMMINFGTISLAKSFGYMSWLWWLCLLGVIYGSGLLDWFTCFPIVNLPYSSARRPTGHQLIYPVRHTYESNPWVSPVIRDVSGEIETHAYYHICIYSLWGGCKLNSCLDQSVVDKIITTIIIRASPI